jgi:hypothetical protein
MRKLILIAAMSLLATQALAGERSLSLASSPPAQATEQPAPQPADARKMTDTAPTIPAAAATTEPPAASTPAPAIVPRPAIVPPQTTTVTTAAAPTVATTEPAKPAATSKPKRRDPSIEARVIRELHRNGIYW